MGQGDGASHRLYTYPPRSLLTTQGDGASHRLYTYPPHHLLTTEGDGAPHRLYTHPSHHLLTTEGYSALHRASVHISTTWSTSYRKRLFLDSYTKASSSGYRSSFHTTQIYINPKIYIIRWYLHLFLSFGLKRAGV